MRILEQQICPNCFAVGSFMGGGGQVGSWRMAGGSQPGGSQPGSGQPGSGQPAGGDYHAQSCSNCGYSELANASSLTLPAGALLGERYLIGRTLGVGGFGITYLALDCNEQAFCAIKEYFPRAFATRETSFRVTASGKTSSPIFTHGYEVFHGEAKILTRFAGKPLIVQARDYLEDNNTAYFVMEYLDGLNAKALLRSSNGRLPLEQAMTILFAMINALALVHAEGYLHRDISPENIFITRSGHIKLIDFGSTRFFVGERSRNLSVILKPGFAPPEQYSSRGNQGPWTDLYALAATFYFLATGVRVPDAPDRLDKDTLTPIAQMLPNLHPALADVLGRCLRLDFRERVQDTAQFLGALEAPSSNTINHGRGGTPYVLVQSGKSAGVKWALPSDTNIIVGRSPQNCNIVVSDPGISRKHCVIRYSSGEGCFTVTDTSANGTFTEDGTRLRSDVPHVIEAQRQIWLTEQKITLQIGVE
jgi:serine/threonine protein kinase